MSAPASEEEEPETKISKTEDQSILPRYRKLIANISNKQDAVKFVYDLGKGPPKGFSQYKVLETDGDYKKEYLDNIRAVVRKLVQHYDIDSIDLPDDYKPPTYLFDIII